MQLAKHVENAGNVPLKYPGQLSPTGVAALAANGVVSPRPAAGRLRKLGFILASEDAVALDAVFASIVGLNPKDVDAIRIAQERKLGNASSYQIDVVGKKIEDAGILDFELPAPSGLKRVPAPLLRFLSKKIWFRPAVDPEKCNQCMLCQESCPVKAISVKESKINYKKCISCLCCMEICPHDALILKRSLLAKIFTMGWRLR